MTAAAGLTSAHRPALGAEAAVLPPAGLAPPHYAAVLHTHRTVNPTRRFVTGTPVRRKEGEYESGVQCGSQRHARHGT